MFSLSEQNGKRLQKGFSSSVCGFCSFGLAHDERWKDLVSCIIYMPGSRVQGFYLTVEVGHQMIYKLELEMGSLLSRTFSIQYYVKKC